MTFTELMLQKFPDADLRNLFIDCCPCNFGIETEMTRLCDNGHGCFEDCKICWNSQIVGDYITAKKKNNNETLVEKLNYIKKNAGLINDMKKSCIKEAKKYLPQVALIKLIDSLKKNEENRL